jgi:phasin protein
MSTTENKPAGKSGGRKGKGERRKKAVTRQSLPESPAPAQLQSADQELQQPEPVHAESPTVEQPAIEEPVVVAAVASPEPQPAAAPSPSEPTPAEPPPTEPVLAAPPAAEPALAEPSPAEPTPAEPTPAAEPLSAAPASAEPAPVSLQTIANAYRDYTRKSLEEFGSFVEQLSGVRSLDKAMTVQSEFVKRAYETSVAESQKICELHNRLAKQSLDPFKGLTGKPPATHGKS